MKGKNEEKCSKKRILGLLVLTVLILTTAAWLLVFRVNRFSLELEMLGEQKVIHEYGSPYIDPGVTPMIRGTLFWQDGYTPKNLQVACKTNLDSEKLGRYTYQYCAEFWNCTAEMTREILVIDTSAPVITLVPDPPEALDAVGPYQEAGFSATDNYDGDITQRVIRTVEPGQIVYAVTDSSGNPAVAKRKIPNRDLIAPEIRLEGEETWVISVGIPYEEPGYTAEDNIDGDISEFVEVSGSIDRFTPGEYPITYRVTDTSYNETVITRNVKVQAQEWPDTVYPEGKVVYLTFDDGPSAYTRKLLNVLDAYHAKATFFVVGSEGGETMREIVRRGHSIGVHAMEHEYDKIYASPDAYFEDLLSMQAVIQEATGVKTTLMRFPGGSSNLVSRRSSEGIMTFLTQAVQDAGFQYFDWNVYSGDAGDTRKSSQVTQNVIEGIQKQRVSIVLQHDIHKYSVDAVEEILAWGNRHGYQFLALQPDSPAFHHDLNN